MKWVALVALFAAAPAFAQEDKPHFCPNRPSLGSSTCVTDLGRVVLELSGFDWQRDDTAEMREDTMLTGDLLARFGVGPRTEVQLSWTTAGRVRTRNKATGAVDAVTGTGDVRLGLRQNLRNPDGSGLSVALESYVTLPVGRAPIGAGDWSAGVVIPIAYELGGKTDIGFTGTLAAATDQDGDGRHASASGTLGIGRDLTATLSGVAEISVMRDDDPAGATTQALAALSFAWQPRLGRQIDLLAVAGLSRDAPDVRLVIGGAVLF